MTKIYLFIALFLTIFTLNSAQAATALSPEQWKQLVQRAVVEGTQLETALGTSLSLTYKEAIDENNYKVTYFTVMGQFSRGTYYVHKLSLVYEVWSKQDANSVIHQRAYVFNTDGTLSDMYHRKIVKTPEGGVTIEHLPSEGIESAKEHQLILEIISVFVPPTAPQP